MPWSKPLYQLQLGQASLCSLFPWYWINPFPALKCHMAYSCQRDISNPFWMCPPRLYTMSAKSRENGSWCWTFFKVITLVKKNIAPQKCLPDTFLCNFLLNSSFSFCAFAFIYRIYFRQTAHKTDKSTSNLLRVSLHWPAVKEMDRNVWDSGLKY